MKVLVTGGGGFLGRYLTEQLIERGETVRIFSRGPYPELRELGVEVVQGDLRNPEEVQRACAGQETVFHVAAVPGVWGSWKQFHSINTEGTLNVIAACQSAGVSRLIYTSSPSVIYDGCPHENGDESLPYPDPNNYLCHYPHTKALAEQAVLKANSSTLSTVALRPHLIWGPRDNHLIPRLIQRAKSGRLRRVGDGQNLISMSCVENVARAHLQAEQTLSSDAPHSGRAYFINEREPVNLWDWIDELLTRAGLPKLKKTISAKAAWRIGAGLEFLYRTLRISAEPPMTRFVASQLSSSHYYSIANAERDFGYTPELKFEDAMRQLEPELKRLAGMK